MVRDTFLRYLVDQGLKAQQRDEPTKLPPMDELAKEMGVSRGKLREELISAQAWGIVEMRPGAGTYVRPFDFYTPVRTTVLFGIACDRRSFDRYYDLRAKLEIAFWEEAATKLGREEKDRLHEIVDLAEQRLQGSPVEIPHREHRDFHLLVFSNLGNEFVLGLLRAYWDAYEAVGLHLYFDYSYYEKMWRDHRALAEIIEEGRHEDGEKILLRHFTMLRARLEERE